jgi:very-short-patch-repair endonuclease
MSLSKKNSVCSNYREKLKKNATPSEIKMKKILQDGKINFIFQKGWLKNGFFISDFYLPKYKTVIEIDGEYHNTSEQISKDKKKDVYYKNRGFSVLRFTNVRVLTDLLSAADIIQQIKNVKKTKRTPGFCGSKSVLFFPLDRDNV